MVAGNPYLRRQEYVREPPVGLWNTLKYLKAGIHPCGLHRRIGRANRYNDLGSDGGICYALVDARELLEQKHRAG